MDIITGKVKEHKRKLDLIDNKLKVISSYFFKEAGVSEDPFYLRYDSTDDYGGGYVWVFGQNDLDVWYEDLVKINVCDWETISEDEWIIVTLN
tara:strand:- start:12 stop:290 length:279 start_codon:yes stop_codon:yes gene_type:complete